VPRRAPSRRRDSPESELNAFGILVFPKISIVLVFLVMAIVLIVRPWGLLGRSETAARSAGGAVFSRWRPFGVQGRLFVILALAAAALLPLVAGSYFLGVATEVLIFMLYAASLHFLLADGGLASFGHAAYFGLGSYGAAIALKVFGLGMETAIPAGVLLGFAGALVFGWFCVRLSGVYFAMLTLAFAQIAWSIAYQWTDVTGGDNGIIGVWPSAWAASPTRFYWLTLALSAGAIGLLSVITFSPFGYTLRALRDSTLRAETIGIVRWRVQWMGFVIAGAFAALAGALYAFLKGSVFPDNISISLSIDGLVMVLLGGVGTVSGGVVGAAIYRSLSIWVISHTDHSKLVLGALIILLVVLFPTGLVGQFEAWRSARTPSRLLGES
jgi:branched-chain amino acid transport system permease protein